MCQKHSTHNHKKKIFYSILSEQKRRTKIENQKIKQTKFRVSVKDRDKNGETELKTIKKQTKKKSKKWKKKCEKTRTMKWWWL